MPLNLSGNSSCSHDKGYKFGAFLFDQKTYSMTNYTESNIEEDIDMKNQFR